MKKSKVFIIIFVLFLSIISINQMVRVNQPVKTSETDEFIIPIPFSVNPIPVEEPVDNEPIV